MPNLYLQQADGTPVATFKLYNDFTARAEQEEVTVIGIIPEAVSAVPMQEQAGSYARTESPDLLDGGMMCAGIEAEEAVDPEGDAAYWRARAEKVEREWDKVEEERRTWYDAAIKAMADLERAEQPRPLTADDVERALDAAVTSWRTSYPPEDQPYETWKTRQATWSALKELGLIATEPPARPEGAEEIEAIIADQISGDVGPATIRDLADRIATEAGLTPSNPEKENER